ncbi:MAG: class I SAM-dependent methyltransferase [Hyphomonas sp.]|uniref:class I SAM-dependent methyltransferase n=1 Tax=Hyphomonas sp. TaxID=87 RepID=UPI0017E55B32|nr:class I SAM-dependent methyltransferase [Hyphomonas sp.]MBA3067672.1 class I SAM-dependent methyltransferase [Hyphomonas sp.]MBU3919185.1 class I SAM-dependent methyltransferase [Alphaproteobacteria bacterium]MBU4062242.1 class I SAM-dependent methyltransferase [Alphaproteobacteria bacterium]MBU4165677.1 class I SAM-dependent methyltransferase [Alphaproteobacteria bacterium]
MGLLDRAAKSAGRARYAAGQGLRSAWYAAQMQAVRRRAGGFDRPGEPEFRPSRGRPDLAALRKAYVQLFLQDRANVEAGLYPAPDDLNLAGLPGALKSARAFLRDAAEVNRRRLARDGTEVRAQVPEGTNRYPAYYLQNFHYQSGGWFTDDSAELYDTQVEALFSGTADAMRRAALAEISREMKGRDQRTQRLLDVASGNGRFLETVLNAYPKLRVTGIDLSPSYTDAARVRLAPWTNAELVHDAAEAMPLDAESQDIAVSIFLFHELPQKVRVKVLAEIFRVLKPGGAFILADSVQFGDYPSLDGLLEYFPHGFHEPYYKSYLGWNTNEALEKQGFVKERATLAFLTKVTVWRRPCHNARAPAVQD